MCDSRMKHVIRVVGSLELEQTLIISSEGLRNTVLLVFSHEIDISSWQGIRHQAPEAA